jgi:hypothetical protein
MHGPRDLSPLASRIVATHAALAGLCPLIPLPFLDDVAVRRVARRMHRTLFAAHGLTLPPARAKLLDPRAGPSTAAELALLPLKRTLQKVAVVLALKECVDVATALYNDGWLIAQVLADSREIAGPGRSPTDPAVLRRVRKAMLRTYKEVDPAPLRRALAGAFLGVRVGAGHALRAVKRLLRAGRPAGDDSIPDDVEALSARMRAAAMHEPQYLEQLEQRFRRNLGLPQRDALGAPPPGP